RNGSAFSPGQLCEFGSCPLTHAPQARQFSCGGQGRGKGADRRVERSQGCFRGLAMTWQGDQGGEALANGFRGWRWGRERGFSPACTFAAAPRCVERRPN